MERTTLLKQVENHCRCRILKKAPVLGPHPRHVVIYVRIDQTLRPIVSVTHVMEIGELLRAGGCLTPGLRDFLCLPRSDDGEPGCPTYQDSIRFYLADQKQVESLTLQV